MAKNHNERVIPGNLTASSLDQMPDLTEIQKNHLNGS